ncbi:hypothetical protein BJ165DRAFT_1518900 [Panaeolus papilionaceus]|nr:hypothetical protein BJ165DRAFT_1518900 [Panaeolus papilionaceus]
MTPVFDIKNIRTDKITFFDIRTESTPDQSFSPWTRVTRYALQVKGIPFHAEPIEAIDIPALSKALGLKPGVGFTPEPMYTLPAIYDPTTKKALVDTLAISLYLDAQYPSTTRLVPPGTEGLMRAFLDALKTLDMAVVPVGIERAIKKFGTERSMEHVRASRERVFGTKIENLTARGEEAVAAAWAGVRKAFDGVDAWFGESDKLFIMGGTHPTQADLHIASRLRFFRLIFGADGKEWKDIEGWNGGRWLRILQYFDNLAPSANL